MISIAAMKLVVKSKVNVVHSIKSRVRISILNYENFMDHVFQKAGVKMAPFCQCCSTFSLLALGEQVVYARMMRAHRVDQLK